MNNDLAIETAWENSEAGTPEESSTFAAIGIRFGNLWLTEAEDSFVNRIRQQVYLSAYPLAEWLAWNWWRLRWEPRRHSHDWAMAHRMSNIGGGYVWPDITVLSDGERIVLIPAPSRPRPSEPLRYLCQTPVVVRAPLFEDAVDAFVQRVLSQLDSKGLRESNLNRLWADLAEERGSPEISRQRKLEALLGSDVDEADEKLIERLIEDVAVLGEPGVQELAAAHGGDRVPASSAEIRDAVQKFGFESNPRDAARLRAAIVRDLPTGTAAWKRGVAAARALREQEGLGSAPISNDRLCQLVGVGKATIDPKAKRGPLTFAFDEAQARASVVMRSGYETGRRFDLARLLGDRIAADMGILKPATRTYTYRQKLQRAFAGEFLCPFDQLADILEGDFGEEAIEDAAQHFRVSVLTVRTLLANHSMIDRDTLNDDFDVSTQLAA